MEEILKKLMEPSFISSAFAAFACNEALANIKGFLSSNENDFNSILGDSISEASKLFSKKHPEIPLVNSKIKIAFEDTVTEILSSEEEQNPGSSLSRQLIKNEVLFFEDKKRSEFFNNDYSKIFLVVFYGKLLKSSKYSGVVKYNLLQGINNKIDQKTEEVLAGQENLTKKLERFEKLAIGSNISSQNKNNSLFTQDEKATLSDEVISQVEEIERLQVSATLDVKKVISKLALSLIFRIRKQEKGVGNKVLRHYISSCIRAKEDESAACIKQYDNHIPDIFKSPYTECQRVALLTNIGKTKEALEAIHGISRSDVLLFSKEERNNYYRLYALSLLNVGQVQEAQVMFKNIIENEFNEDTEFLRLLLFKDRPDDDLTKRALDIIDLENPSTRLLVAASSYFLSQFDLAKVEQQGNFFKATEVLKSTLERMYEKLLTDKEEFFDHSPFIQISGVASLLSTGFILNKHREILFFADIAIKRGIKSPQILINTAICHYIERNYRECFVLLCSLDIVTVLEFGTESIYLDSAFKLKEFDHLRGLKDLSLNGLTQEQEDILVLSIDKILLGTEKVLSKYEDMPNKYPLQVWPLLSLSVCYIEVGDLNKSEETLLKCLKLEPHNPKTIGYLANFYFKNKGDYPEAAKYYEMIITPAAPDEEKFDYLLSLYNSNDFNEALAKIDKLDPTQSIRSLQLLRGYSLDRLGYIDLAIKVIKPFVYQKEVSASELSNYLIILQKKEDYDEMFITLKRLLEFQPEDKITLINYTKILLKKKMYRDAVFYSKKALGLDFYNELSHFLFFIAYIEATQQLPEDQDLKNREFFELFCDVRDNFQIRFPNSKLLTSTEITYNEDGSPNLGPFKEVLSSQEKRRSEVLNLYTKDRVPASFVATVLGKNVFETWSILLSIPANTGGFYGDAIDPSKVEDEKNLLNSSHEVAVCSYTLLSMSAIDKLDYLKSLPKVIILGSTRSEIQKSLNTANKYEVGQMSIGLEKNQFVKEVTTKRQVEFSQKVLRNALDFIDRHCEVRSIPETKFTRFQNEFGRVISTEFKELLYQLENNSLPLLTADGGFKLISQQKSLPLVGINSFLRYLNISSHFPGKEILESFFDLISLNYKGIPYTSQSCALYLLNCKFQYRKERVLNRVFTSCDFNDEMSRIEFIGSLIAFYSKYSLADEGNVIQALKSHFEKRGWTVNELVTMTLGAVGPFLQEPKGIEKPINILVSLDLCTDQGETFGYNEIKQVVVTAHQNLQERERLKLFESLRS